MNTISGRKKLCFPNPVWCGSHSHQTDLSFEKTVLLAVSVQKGRKPSNATQRKNAEARSPFLSTGRTDREAGFHTLFHHLQHKGFHLGLLFLFAFLFFFLLAHIIFTTLLNVILGIMISGSVSCYTLLASFLAM